MALLTLAAVRTGSAFAADHPALAKAPFNAEQAKQFQQQWAEHIDRPLVHTSSIGMKMVLLPPGEFTMGLTGEQHDKILNFVKEHKDERIGKHYHALLSFWSVSLPGHRVRLTKPFYMGAHEVTVGQFRKFCEASGYKTLAEQALADGKPDRGKKNPTWRAPSVGTQAKNDPVLHVCWDDCVAFCEWLSKQEGQEYGLPTDAQWEYACRAGTTTAWHFGDPEDYDRAAHEYSFTSSLRKGGKNRRPRAVGLGKPNAFGLYDMHGNVWEWVHDWLHRYYYKDSPLNDPSGPATHNERGLMRIIRGAAFDWGGELGSESFYRMRIGQTSHHHSHVGFRVAMKLKDVQRVPLAIDLDDHRRQKQRDRRPSAIKIPLGGDHPKELTIELPSGVKMEFVLIQPGSFLMGSDKGSKDEQPVHRVVISKPFYMAKYQVTQAQWEAVVGEDERLKFLKGSKQDFAGPMKAMNGLSWNDCQDFIGKLKRRASGHAFALPIEAQWEYACRAGSRDEYYFGDDASVIGDYAWCQVNMGWNVRYDNPSYKGRNSYPDVGKKKPNAWGLYDMHGCNWEWCADWYDKDYYLDSPLKDPKGPGNGRFRVLRGGSWYRYPKYARSAYRRFRHPDVSSDTITFGIQDYGCRLVINLP